MSEKKRVHLFNCDNTYDLTVVNTWILAVQEKIPFTFTVSKHYFSLRDMSKLCENTISKLHIDFAFLVVNAEESRLLFNDSKEESGYTKVYRALLDATGEKVSVVIGGDSHYKNQEEEYQNVLSRWAHRIVSSQLKEEFRDGRKSFVFSWNEKHRAIHEQALLHFLDPKKAGVKFGCQSEMLAKPDAAGVVEKSISALNIGTCDVVDSSTKENGKGVVDFLVLCGDQSAVTVIRNMYPSSMLTPSDIHVGSPKELKSHLPKSASVSLCAIGLQASDLKEIASSNEWEKSDFGELVRTVQKAADKVVVVIMYSEITAETLPLPQSEEVQVTEKVELLLGEKGIVLWWRGRPRQTTG
ncbi:uncharacterized protein [Pocillopora verrucosa]|uniref:uncharacterized protein n=1 Tax=Pocillopora verrucosa TaxID=203993 RepID=UPI00334124DA